MTVMESPEYELCLTKTLNSFKRAKEKNKFLYKRTPANRIYDIYIKEGRGIDQFAVDYILLKNNQLSAPFSIRKAIEEIGDFCINTAAKQVVERMLIEKEQAEKEKAAKEEKQS